METKATEFIVIPLDEYNKLRKTAVKFKLISEHVKSVYARGGNRYDLADGLFRAVFGIAELEKGEKE